MFQRLGRSKLFLPCLIFIIVTSITATLFITGGFQRLEWFTFDQRQRMFRSSAEAPEDIAIILIDEQSLEKMDPLVGRWPWPRSIYADLIEFLAKGSAKAAVFDVILIEQERTCNREDSISEGDQRLIVTAANHNFDYQAVLIYHDSDEGEDTLNRPLPPPFIQKYGIPDAAAKGFETGWFNSFKAPMWGLDKTAKGMGAVDMTPDPDGAYRRVQLFREYGGALFPSIAMAPLLDFIDRDAIFIGDNVLQLGDIAIPLDDFEQYLVNFYGNFNAYSFSDIYTSIEQMNAGKTDNLPVPPDVFADKIVFIGVSAAGLKDVKPTAISGKTPGVFIHASVAGNIRTQDFLIPIKPALTIVLILLFSLGTIIVIFKLNKFYLQVMVPLLLAFLYMIWTVMQFNQNMVYDSVPPVVAIVLSWLGSFAVLSFTEGKAKRHVRKIFSQYVSPEVLNELTEKSEDILGKGISRKEQVTVLFSDVRSFTSISEMLDAEQIVDLLNCHFAAMTDTIFKHRGTLDKFIGDAIMAFWGAPIKVENHALRATLAAMEMLRRLDDVNKELIARGYPAIDIGIGLNTGEVVLGNIGSEKKLDYTVIGDTVNIASRLEGLTKQYGCPIIISEYTKKELGPDIPCMLIDQVRVKGKVKPVKLFSPLAGPDDPAGVIKQAQLEAEQVEKAISFYQAGDWGEAGAAFESISNETLKKLYQSRCIHFLSEPPPESWDGVFTMKTK